VDDPEWLSEDERGAWLVFVEVMVRGLATLDSQLQRDSGISHFEYGILAGLSEAPGQTLQMSLLAGTANGSLSRLSHAVKRLEERGWVRRAPNPGDGRLTDAILTDAGREKVVASAPGHVGQVRRLVIDPLTPEQLEQLRGIGLSMLGALDATEPSDWAFPRRPGRRSRWPRPRPGPEGRPASAAVMEAYLAVMTTLPRRWAGLASSASMKAATSARDAVAHGHFLARADDTRGLSGLGLVQPGGVHDGPVEIGPGQQILPGVLVRDHAVDHRPHQLAGQARLVVR
jgi:DNA-binding MarR family transcriptional regulator